MGTTAASLPFPPQADASKDNSMQHVVLLGDSIFDNAAYVAGGPEVLKQLRERLPGHWQATLNAVDGAVTGGVERQLQRLPPDASHLVISVGGNDALHHAGLLDQGARSVAEALSHISDVREQFQRDYSTMIAGVLNRKLPTSICTIYDARFPDPQRRRLANTALAVFNDVITRTAFMHGLTLIDLRLICNEDVDYANPIEPSVTGGAKIASVIAAVVLEHAARSRSEVYAR
ncbi:SGNH/GDSL hydrolase family protein [Mangrovicella endophytica]|uniref:SGNH/GDSL hydrolase family protein n=1 Tax=Mangrovicella endophytica TaxID=2066697 RepID=UPI001FE1FF09|nr:SGNH/GDSL hydrolase family protein [Mangrovicella endophytica]